jgi:hypothetical protein
VPAAALEAAYSVAVGTLSERLGADTWLLGLRALTALDARPLAALHRTLAVRAERPGNPDSEDEDEMTEWSKTGR